MQRNFFQEIKKNINKEKAPKQCFNFKSISFENELKNFYFKLE